ncbi:aminotransferase class III-fold pyridoxal phosphate-dependent enzyme [Rubripirellula reticaptiva]|uniref:Putative L-lysine-epsilon aminotransferase n=1 Tax=Rubripirellula reticaptiva TaxID=2528013 RepID=A0A5C6F7S2_9BACT|nr:aminotransferase class III-fold pyridoxal phosphate-dependent enzyme [Rubripirellula reticaptiva]TWU57763.1 putative L-lysine-epsilon aminotransferase [Rubripirellula reticaptiva]
MESSVKKSLNAESLRADPRIAEARRLIAEAVADHSATMTAPKDPDPALVTSYQALLERLGATRGGPPFLPYLSSGLGNGPMVELADGSIKMDFIGGIGVHGCGHSHPAMIDAAIDGALEDTVMQGNLQQHPPSIKMSERLIELAKKNGARMDHCLLSTSGAMANENALKIAMHHNSPADRVIAFDNAFAGRSLAMAALTDKAKYRMGLPLVVNVDYLPFRDQANPKRSQKWAVDELHRLLKRHPGRYAAFWAEPVAGEGGYYPGSHEFFAAISKPLRDAGVPIIFDEVQSFSRTSMPFAFQHYGLDEFADIVTLGKITQVCATLYGKDFVPKGPLLSQTFTGASSSIASGIKILELLDAEGCFGKTGKNMTRHAYFAAALEKLHQKYPKLVNGPFGEGMMIAFTPGDGSYDQAKLLMDTMFDLGLLCFLCGGDPTRIRFLPPPVTTTHDHIDAAIGLLDKSLEAFAKKLG